MNPKNMRFAVRRQCGAKEVIDIVSSELLHSKHQRRPRLRRSSRSSQLAINNNKLARLAAERRERNKNKNVVVEHVTIEDRLARLEEDIRRLKVEYDVYFNGGSKRPPYDTKLRLESHLRRLGDDRSLNFAQRFHYNS